VSAKTRGFQVPAKVRPIRVDVGEEECGTEPETAIVR
jgi:hypothetical protein